MVNLSFANLITRNMLKKPLLTFDETKELRESFSCDKNTPITLPYKSGKSCVYQYRTLIGILMNYGLRRRHYFW